MVIQATDCIYEPDFTAKHFQRGFFTQHNAAAAIVSRYLRGCADYVRQTYQDAAPWPLGSEPVGGEHISDILLRHQFNYQAKGRVAHLLPALHAVLSGQIAQRKPLQLFLSYNGGYHATTRPDYSQALGFDAMATELLLLYQIARLERQIAAIYAPGMVFTIVLNNGVAHYVNDIPVARTEDYGRQLEAMVARLAPASGIRVLMQSSMGDFCTRMRDVPGGPAAELDPVAHRNIQRFLGRECSEAEARMRGSLSTSRGSVVGGVA